MAKTRPIQPLLYSDTRRSADALYFGGVAVPDPFIAFSLRGSRHAVVSALEFGRVRRSSRFDKVLPLEALLAEARARWPRTKVGAADVIALLSAKLRAGTFTVPSDFPAGLYRDLVERGVKLDIAKGPLFPEREIKTPAEAEQIRRGNACSAHGIGAAEKVLRASKIRSGRLYYQGSVLTSERLKFAIETACLEAGGISAETIAAGGDQACDPHDRGSGPLRPGELIVVDVFPQLSGSGYHGDMTRTFLKGRATEAQKKIVAAVREAQLAALGAIRTGVNGRDVHGLVAAHFESVGFRTTHSKSGSAGFFHGTGHGLGLEIHEPPRMGPTVDYFLKKGSVVTVEPGLYYPGIGGCRIEDVVQVTDRAPRMLSDFHYAWEIA